MVDRPLWSWPRLVMTRPDHMIPNHMIIILAQSYDLRSYDLIIDHIFLIINQSPRVGDLGLRPQGKHAPFGAMAQGEGGAPANFLASSFDHGRKLLPQEWGRGVT